MSDLFEGNVVLRPTVTTLVPVVRDGQVRHALALSREPAALRALLARQDLPAGTFAAIADSRFRLLAHSRDPDGRLVGAATPDWVPAAIEGRQRSFVTGRGLDGQDNVYAIERLSRAPGWTVVVAQPVSMQRAAAWRAVQWLLAGGAAFGIGLAAAVWADRREAVRDARREARALREGREEVRRLHAGLPAVLFLRELRPDGSSHMLYRGGDFAAVTGWPDPKMAQEEDLTRFTWPGDPVLADVADTLRRDGEARFEWRMLQPGGGVRWLSTLARTLDRRDDGTIEVVGYTLDLTAEREAKARALAATRLASLGEMAAGLAHELRQPLQSISFAAEIGKLALGRHDEAEADRRLDTVVEQAQRAGDLIDQLRRFARGAEDGDPPSEVRLSAVVEAALVLTGSVLRDAGVEMGVSLGDPPPVVRGQPVLLEQVLANLLLNTRDALALRPPGAPRRVAITAGPGPDGTAWLQVADTGGGIATEVLNRIFEPFVTTKGPDKGTGLGLSICHGLVTGMGGTITARNDTEGAVFRLTLPGSGVGSSG